MLKNKNILLILIPAIFLFINCFTREVKKENLIRPSYDVQKTYVMRQLPIEMGIIYNVWDHLPLDLVELDTYKKLQEQKLFSAVQKLKLTGLEFVVKDKKNKVDYILEETFTDNSTDRNKHFSIVTKNKQIAQIDQVYYDDFLLYEIKYKNRIYSMEGNIKKYGNNIHSIIFSIMEENQLIGSIFKEYKYLKNKYEIIIDSEKNSIDDPIYICLGVIVDQMLRENGYHFK